MPDGTPYQIAFTADAPDFLAPGVTPPSRSPYFEPPSPAHYATFSCHGPCRRLDFQSPCESAPTMMPLKSAHASAYDRLACDMPHIPADSMMPRTAIRLIELESHDARVMFLLHAHPPCLPERASVLCVLREICEPCHSLAAFEVEVDTSSPFSQPVISRVNLWAAHYIFTRFTCAMLSKCTFPLNARVVGPGS